MPQARARYALFAAVPLLFFLGRHLAAKSSENNQVQAAPVFERVRLAVDRESVLAGEPLSIAFDKPIRMPEGYAYWISIVPHGSEIYAQGTWQYVKPGTTELAIEAPKQPGLYEIRLHAHMNKIISSKTIAIKEADSSVTPEYDPIAAGEKH